MVEGIKIELEKRKGQRDHTKTRLESVKKSLREARKELKRTEHAREIIREVGIRTQRELQYHISDLVSSALSAVYPDDPYDFSVEFVRQRNRTECLLRLERGGTPFHPLEATGGGVVDVAAFALRIVSWTIERPRRRNALILDEPFRFLDRDAEELAGEMLKEMAGKLGLQIIMVTHSERLAEAADRCFRVVKKGETSHVERVE